MQNTTINEYDISYKSNISNLSSAVYFINYNIRNLILLKTVKVLIISDIQIYKYNHSINYCNIKIFIRK